MAENLATSKPMRKYFYELDFIKAVAIFFVLAFHFWGQLSGWHMKVVNSDWFINYWQNLSNASWQDLFLGILKFKEAYFYLGVNLFVIASGFGLYFSYLKEGKIFHFIQFLQKRVWRLIPSVILATIMVFFIKGFLLNTWAIQNWYLNLFPFLGGLNLFSDNWFFPPIDGEMWFLGLMIQLYFLFPILSKLLDKLGEKKFLFILFLVSIIFRTLYYVFWKDSISSLSYGLSIGRLFEFGFGMVLAQKATEGKNISYWWLLGLTLFWGYFWSFSFPFSDALIGVGLFALLWHIAHIFERFASAEVFKSVAAQSYLMFLVHHPIIWILNKYGLYDFWNFTGIIIFLGLFLLSYFVAVGGNWLLQKLKLA